MGDILLLTLYLRWPACCYFQKMNTRGLYCIRLFFIDLKHAFTPKDRQHVS